MAKILDYSEIRQILYGATFLGGGGGGPLETALEILDKLKAEHRDLRVELVDLSEVDSTQYGAMVACLGSPEAMKVGTFGPDGVASFEAFQKAALAETPSKDVRYLFCGEMGGFNTFSPLLVSIYSGDGPENRIKLVDVDANGRAVPELNTSLNAARGFAPYPVGMGSLNGNKIVAYGINDSESEAIARALCGLYNNQIGFSTWAMNQAELKENAVVGCVSKALGAGQAIELGRDKGVSMYSFILSHVQCRLFCKAKIVDKETHIDHGFDVGTTVLQDVNHPERKYQIKFQNENLVMLDAAGVAVATAPEIITLVNVDEGDNFDIPMSNAATEVGMTVEVYLAPADPLWWSEDRQAYKVWLPCLERVGYTGPLVHYDEYKISP